MKDNKSKICKVCQVLVKPQSKRSHTEFLFKNQKCGNPLLTDNC